MSTLILGLGHVGKALLARNEQFLFTNRIKKLPQSIIFDLENRSTWKLIPKCDNIIWTFPAKPLELVKEFFQEKLTKVPNLIVLGSTSCYINKRQAEKIDENSPLDMTLLRVQGEEFLRQKGATILCLAGIYDQERNPLNWLEKRLIQNPRKVVNLVHTKDIVSVIEFFLKTPQPKERFNVCDGIPRTWQEIGDRIGYEFRMEGEREVSKLIGNDKLKKILPGNFEFFSLYDLWPDKIDPNK